MPGTKSSAPSAAEAGRLWTKALRFRAMTDSRDPLAVQQQAERISQEMRDLARANPGMSHRDVYNLLTVLFKDEVGRTPDKTRGERPLRADPQRGRLDAQEGSQAHPCPGLAAAQRTETAFVRRFRATAGRYDSEHPQGRLTQGCCNPGTRTRARTPTSAADCARSASSPERSSQANHR